jgi:hypothetical protein
VIRKKKGAASGEGQAEGKKRKTKGEGLARGMDAREGVFCSYARWLVEFNEDQFLEDRQGWLNKCNVNPYMIDKQIAGGNLMELICRIWGLKRAKKGLFLQTKWGSEESRIRGRGSRLARGECISRRVAPRNDK